MFDPMNPYGSIAQPGQFVDVQPKKSGGMFGGGDAKFGIGQALVAALNGYLAAGGNPVGIQNMRMMQEAAQAKRQRQQELEDYNRKRADENTDWTARKQWEIEHPAPVNNDTVADYEFWKRTLPPNQFQTWLQNKIDPPQLMQVPGVGIVSVPRQAPQGAPSAPVGKLKPYNPGGPTPDASGGFPY